MNNYSLYFASGAAGGCALVATLIVTPLALRLGWKLRIVDLPAERKVHSRPVPYLGGMSFFFAFSIATLILAAFFEDLWQGEFFALFVGSLLICLMGSLDDILGLGARSKLPVEILIVILVYMMGVRIERVSNPFGEPFVLGWMALPVTVLWYLAIMNAMNLSDGLDGLAAGIACIASATMFFIGAWNEDVTVCLPSAIVFGTTLGIRVSHSCEKIHYVNFQFLSTFRVLCCRIHPIQM